MKIHKSWSTAKDKLLPDQELTVHLPYLNLEFGVKNLDLSSKRVRTLLIPVQVTVSGLILYFLLRNVALAEIYAVLFNANLLGLLLSAAFCILSSFAVGFALHSALKSTDSAPPFHITQLANFGGQLLSDITPAKSGYFATPVLLNQLKAVPLEKGLMSVMAVGAVNFFIKAIFSTVALLYFLGRISIAAPAMNGMLIGISLLLIGGVGLTVLVWTNCLSNLLLKLSKLPIIGIVIRKLDSIRATFVNDKAALRKSVKTTVLSIFASILLSATAMYIAAQAIGLTQPSFQDLLFLGPLTAVFMYVPITFAGFGLTEAASAFVLIEIGAPPAVALSFALLTRFIGLSTDLIGLPPLVKTSTGIFSKLNKTKKSSPQESPQPPVAPPNIPL